MHQHRPLGYRSEALPVELLEGRRHPAQGRLIRRNHGDTRQPKTGRRFNRRDLTKAALH